MYEMGKVELDGLQSHAMEDLGNFSERRKRD